MKIIILDIETTNFLNKGGKIVEIGIVELNLKTGEKKIIFDKVVWETGITRKEVEESWIVNNSSLTTEKIRTSKNLEKYKFEIQVIINSYPLGATAFNNGFDFGFMENRGFHFPEKLPCPMKLSTNICKIPGKYGDYKWPKCEEAYHHFFPNSNFVEKHRGADDAFHEADIVKKLFDLGIFKLNK